MTCLEAKELIAVAVYGKPNPGEEARLAEHLKTCAACAGLRNRLAPAAGLAAGEPDFSRVDPVRSWRRVSADAFPDPARPVRRRIFWKTVLATAGVLAVFILGYLAGTKRSVPQEALVAAAGPAPGIDRGSPLRRYALDIEPVLSRFAGPAGAAPVVLSEPERRAIRDMRLRASLLRDMALEKGIPGLVDLLEDLEIILVQLSGLRADDAETRTQLSRSLREKEILARLKILSAPAGAL